MCKFKKIDAFVNCKLKTERKTLCFMCKFNELKIRCVR